MCWNIVYIVAVSYIGILIRVLHIHRLSLVLFVPRVHRKYTRKSGKNVCAARMAPVFKIVSQTRPCRSEATKHLMVYIFLKAFSEVHIYVRKAAEEANNQECTSQICRDAINVLRIFSLPL